ncbi:TIGR04141 family sporadically distributed protein [Streptomyces sp. NPDC059340]|uniref:TIGR04141 family sporadically distributed protein n=1 Tax=Streptomyces sp. NPDC059340 TaxID=3346806 RepID=UPI003683C15D
MTAGEVGSASPLGIEEEDLVADIREIARVCRDESPQSALEFVEHIVPLKDDPTVARLEHTLDEALGEPAYGRVAGTVPMDHWEDYTAAHTFHIKINSSEAGRFEQFDLEYLLRRARIQRAGRRLEALRQGTVTL